MRILRLQDCGEFGLIKMIDVPLYTPEEVIVAIGDDCAVLLYDERHYQLVSCDLLTEGVHFIRERISAYQLGYKAVAASLSDIAAMGGWPTHIVLSVALPVDYQVSEWQGFYQGVNEICRRYRVNLIGGDTAASNSGLTINVTAMGLVKQEELHLRSSAQVGDLVFVTAPLGGSRAGLELVLRPDLEVTPILKKKLEQAHYQPEPCCQEIKMLNAIFGQALHGLNDISDGLLSECGEIAEASEKALLLELADVPISAEAVELAELLGADGLHWALTGGEDYQLVGTVAAAKAGELAERYREMTGKTLYFIGSVAEGNGVYFLNHGQMIRNVQKGYDHFNKFTAPINDESIQSSIKQKIQKSTGLFQEQEFCDCTGKTNDPEAYIQVLEQRLVGLEQQLERQQYLRHDWKNHMNCIAGLAEIGDLEQVKTYMREACEFLQPPSSTFQYCTNPVLNILFNQKMVLAEKAQTELEICCDVTDLPGISAFDLCSLVSNLLDNGLESAAKTQEAYVYFDLLQMQPDRITIQMRNSCDKAPVLEAGCLLTSKADAELHGKGMRNIQRLARKYQGDCTYFYDADEKSFQTNVFFSPFIEGKSC